MIVEVILALSVTVVAVKADCTQIGGRGKVSVVIHMEDTCCDTDPDCRSSADSIVCRQGWVYYNRSCYAFGDVPQPWAIAASLCTSQGSNLVEIGSAEENNWIVTQLKYRNFGSIWIGATEGLHRGIWQWAKSGKPFTFTDWSESQPSDPPRILEDCLEIREPFGYKWNDFVCDAKNKYICETRPLKISH